MCVPDFTSIAKADKKCTEATIQKNSDAHVYGIVRASVITSGVEVAATPKPPVFSKRASSVGLITSKGVYSRPPNWWRSTYIILELFLPRFDKFPDQVQLKRV